MRKSLLIGLVVCLLALGGIGAAFATGMGFSGVGAISSGQTGVNQANTDYIGYRLQAPPGGGAIPWVNGIWLSFDTDLRENAVIWVQTRDAADGINGLGTANVGASGLANGAYICVDLDQTVDPANIYRVNVQVTE